MAQPSEKDPGIECILDGFVGSRKKRIKSNLCVPKPIGCGQPATKFADALSAKEYTISGLCQECQNAFFGG